MYGSWRWSTGLLAGIAIGCVHVPHSDAPVTGQRPTLASDTATVTSGQAEIEFGVVVDPGDSLDTPTLLKLGAGEATEVFVGFSPLVGIEYPGGDERGFGDATLGARHRFSPHEPGRTSFAGQTSLKVPTSDHDRGLGSGELDLAAAAIATRDIGPLVGTAFYEAGLLGDPAGGTDTRHTFALLCVTPFHGRWSGFAELGAVAIPQQDTEQVLLTLGATLNPTGHMIVDCAVVLGLTEDAPEFAIVFGVTENLACLWHGR